MQAIILTSFTLCIWQQIIDRKDNDREDNVTTH